MYSFTYPLLSFSINFSCSRPFNTFLATDDELRSKWLGLAPRRLRPIQKNQRNQSNGCQDNKTKLTQQALTSADFHAMLSESNMAKIMTLTHVCTAFLQLQRDLSWDKTTCTCGMALYAPTVTSIYSLITSFLDQISTPVYIQVRRMCMFIIGIKRLYTKTCCTDSPNLLGEHFVFFLLLVYWNFPCRKKKKN